MTAPFLRQPAASSRTASFQDAADVSSRQHRPAVPGCRPLAQSVLPERERDLGFDAADEAQSWQNELSDSGGNPWKGHRHDDEVGDVT